MTGESAVRIALLLPDVLGTYSDGGNATVLAQRLRWRGIDADVIPVPAAAAAPTSADIYVLGGGEDAAQAFAATWLLDQPALLTTMATTQVLAVCAGLQVLGRWMEGPGGRRIPGAALWDLTTTAGGRRAVGEVAAQSAITGMPTLTGFENHQGRTVLGEQATALGRVRRGTGNGDGTDGLLSATAVGTYLHGPVLARNPDLADLILRRATGLPLAALQIPDQDSARDLHLRRAYPGRERWMVRRR